MRIHCAWCDDALGAVVVGYAARSGGGDRFVGLVCPCSAGRALTVDRSSDLCCKPADPYCTRPIGHWDACSYFAVWFQDRKVEACERCGGPFGGAAVQIGEQLLCTTCERDDAFAVWVKGLAAQDKTARTQYARKRLNARKREGHEAPTR